MSTSSLGGGRGVRLPSFNRRPETRRTPTNASSPPPAAYPESEAGQSIHPSPVPQSVLQTQLPSSNPDTPSAPPQDSLSPIPQVSLLSTFQNGGQTHQSPGSRQSLESDFEESPTQANPGPFYSNAGPQPSAQPNAGQPLHSNVGTDSQPSTQSNAPHSDVGRDSQLSTQSDAGPPSQLDAKKSSQPLSQSGAEPSAPSNGSQMSQSSPVSPTSQGTKTSSNTTSTKERMENGSAKQPSSNHVCTSSKRLILCFDGTGNQFGDTTSNVVRFFDALQKDNPGQLCYYQPGVGTYSSRRYYTKFVAWASQKLEEALARELDGHVKEGYEFIMRNYNPGDKIFLFGFSRGAYTARALSGMLYKVGLLPRYNDRLLEPAYVMYNAYDNTSAELAKKFKKTFALDVHVEFVGVWDTVSSVGIIPTTLPFSTYNDGVKNFRHALALDERRARFRPCLWGEPRTTREILANDPDINYRGPETPRDRWNFEPIKLTDVKEVWFVGCHADVGGGSYPDKNEVGNSLANIPLRWMIMECFKLDTGIEFKQDTLLSFGFKKDVTNAGYEWGAWKKAAQPADFILDPKAEQSDKKAQPGPSPDTLVPFDPNLQPWVEKDITVDSVANIFDQLKLLFFWWLLEFIPTMALFQTQLGWLLTRERNRGRGRYLPVGEEQIFVHASVLQRMKHTRQAEKDKEAAGKADAAAKKAPDPAGKKPAKALVPPKPEGPYQPAARNWEDMLNNKQLTWVY